ncbi:DUF2726 domain-containing protein [Salinicola sp. V024]|uniref:DUF2726 domain-containing protein n=1 Tax=Salinicola sp. V024 TaxID=3459609 RepID=UPI0040447ACA
MQLNDLVTDVAIVFVVLVISGIAFLATLKSLSRKLISWALISGFKKGYRGKAKKRPAKVTAAELIELGDAYVKKGRLLTESEQILFKVLQHKYGDTHYVFCQVRVVDVIQPNTALYKERSREWMALFRQVSQWHFDFVICDNDSMGVVRVIELDDKTHSWKDRRKRDDLLNRCCHQAGLLLERLSVKWLLEKFRSKSMSFF